MISANIDPAAILNRALESIAQNLRVEKLLIQLGLDPANISYDIVFNRLVDILVAMGRQYENGRRKLALAS